MPTFTVFLSYNINLRMARKDAHHECVKIALEKEGWTVTDDPLDLSMGFVDLLADLGAEKWVEAEMQDKKIAVEIKMFSGVGLVSEFHKAMGRWGNMTITVIRSIKMSLIESFIWLFRRWHGKAFANALLCKKSLNTNQ